MQIVEHFGSKKGIENEKVMLERDTLKLIAFTITFVVKTDSRKVNRKGRTDVNVFHLYAIASDGLCLILPCWHPTSKEINLRIHLTFD